MEQLSGVERHPQARALLETALRADAPAHAYLFYGPSGAGKRAIALAFAASLLADGDAQSYARAQRRAHPDLTWVEPSGAAELLVGDIDHAVVRAASLTPFQARRRVFVIVGAERMGEEAANRLLKTLEEPPPDVHLILIASDRERVIATVRSRCQAVRFEPALADEVAARLAGEGIAEGERALACALLADGDLERARELAQPAGRALRAGVGAFAQGVLERSQGSPWQVLLADARERSAIALGALKEQQERELESVARAERARVARAHSEAQRRLERRVRTERLDLALTLLERYLRDAWALVQGAPELLYAADCLPELEALALDWGADDHQRRERLAAGIESVAATRLRLTLNVSEELACESLFYRLGALAREGSGLTGVQADRGWG
jgi:DNA polymerase-3 subunit delta'